MENAGLSLVDGLEVDIRFLQDLIKASPQVIYVYDQINNRLEYATENLYTIFGYTLQELQSMPGSLWAIVHKDEKALVREHVRLMLKGHEGAPVSSNFRIRHAKGHYVWVNAVDRFFERQADGLVHRTFGFVSDVTAKVEAERGLRISEERYRSLLLNSGDAFCFLKLNGEILDVNTFATSLLGYRRDELLNMNINRIDHGWNTPRYTERLARILPDMPITFETTVVHKDGTPIPVEVRFIKRIEHGDVLIQALVRDRTEKHIQEQKRLKSEEHLRVLVDNVDDVIMTIDWDGTVLSINNPKQGYTEADCVGRSIYEGIDEEQIRATRQGFAQAKATGDPFEMLFRHYGMDDTTEWYLTRYCPVLGGEMLVSVSRNITHIKESELQVMNGMTLGQEQERKRLGAELHDGVGQILSSISLELSQMRMTASCSKEVRSKMEELGQRVAGAISEVRNISHDLMPGVLESFGLSEAIREVCQNMQERTGIRFGFDPVDLCSQYSGPIETHVYRITQELITNSVKHGHCNKVHINLIDHGDLLSLTVEDDGIGFDSEEVTKGIGLKNIASRVSILRGTLSVESSRTSGTLVHIELPKE